MVKLVPIVVILLLSSQVDSWWYWWGQGRPKGEYEAAGRDYGYAEGGEHTLLLSASIKFETSISNVIFVQNSLVSCEIQSHNLPLHHQDDQGDQGNQGDHNDRKVKSR